jgi:Protein of unknown function (DUF3606)
MTRLVLALAALLGWVAYVQLSRQEKTKRLYGERPDAFPFPTGDAVQGIDLEDAASVQAWCETFGCTEEQLRAAVKSIGSTPSDVRRHLGRRR